MPCNYNESTGEVETLLERYQRENINEIPNDSAGLKQNTYQKTNCVKESTTYET